VRKTKTAAANPTGNFSITSFQHLEVINIRLRDCLGFQKRFEYF